MKTYFYSITNKLMANYLNGIFATRKEGQYGEYISIGITEEGLKAIATLEPSEKGFRNFTLSPQKNDPNKYSAKPIVAKETNGSTLPF